MTRYRSSLLRLLDERGYLHQLTDTEGLDALAASGAVIPGYIGFDATAPSLHVGLPGGSHAALGGSQQATSRSCCLACNAPQCGRPELGSRRRKLRLTQQAIAQHRLDQRVDRALPRTLGGGRQRR
jgi:hypothetical protein